MEFQEERSALDARLLEIGNALEETARFVRRHASVDAFTKSGGTDESPECDPHWVRSILDIRALRRQYLDFDASDAALAMLLALYAARLEGRRLTQTALGIAARVPETTTQRITRAFLEAGIFLRIADTKDRRLLLLTLSDDAAARLRAYLAAARNITPLLA